MTDMASAAARSAKEAKNPHRRMHRVVYALVVVCLIAQVIEGSLVVPYVLLYFGFPQLGLKDICDEMYKIVYADEERECEYPYPLFRYEPEPWLQPNREHLFGHVTQPAPGYDMPRFREIIDRRRERLERNGAAAPKSNSEDPPLPLRHEAVLETSPGLSETRGGE